LNHGDNPDGIRKTQNSYKSSIYIYTPSINYEFIWYQETQNSFPSSTLVVFFYLVYVYDLLLPLRIYIARFKAPIMAVTKEELEFLETRKLLKEQIRKRNCPHHLSKLSNSDHHKTKTYGSFFGPSQPSIAPRVIQESKSKLQTQIPQHRAVSADILLSAMDNQTKVQRLRQTRDYSFLFSDDNNLTPPVSSATPTQASVPSIKHYADVKRLRKFNDPELKPKQPALACSLKPLTNKAVMEKIPSRMSLQYQCTDKRKPIIKAVHPTKQFAGSNDSKGPRRPNDATLNPKQPVKPHEMKNKRVRDNISSPAVSNLQDHRPKKRRLSDEEDECEGEKALLIIRKMFNTKRFAGRDDRDIKMEASFGDITKEEKRSERLGRKEDREQLRLLEENARRQRMRKHNQGTKFLI
jgi:protein SPT2